MRKILTAKGGWVLIAILGSGLLLTLALVAVALARPATQLTGPVPTQINYQGYLTDDNGVPITDTLTFTFTLYADSGGTTQLWQEQQNVDVVNGYFSVLLGQVEPLQPADFDGSTRYLGVQPEGAAEMTPRQPIVSVPYALAATHAMTASFALKTAGYDHVIVVAKSGGDYQTINAAMDAAQPAGDTWLIWVAPGVYTESVTVKPDVHLMGAGRRYTTIKSEATCSVGSPPTTATVVMTGASRLSGLSIRNYNSTCGAAVLVNNGEARTLLDDLRLAGVNYTVYLKGGSGGPLVQNSTLVGHSGSGVGSILLYLDDNTAHLRALTGWTDGLMENAYGIYLANGSGVDARDVNLSVNATGYAYGVYNHNSNVTLRNSKFASQIDGGAGMRSTVFHNKGVSATLNIYNVIATAQVDTGLGSSYGFNNTDGATASLYHSVLTARGGNDARGIYNDDHAVLEAESVTILAEDASQYNYGLHNTHVATATLRGGSVTGRGGDADARGIYNYDDDTLLIAENVTVLAEDGADNYGLYNDGGPVAMLRGGMYTAHGGDSAYGIYNHDRSALEAGGVTVLADGAITHTVGLANAGTEEAQPSTALVRNGSFTARGGIYCYGIDNSGPYSALEAEGVTALAEDGSFEIRGLNANTNLTTTLRRGTFIGRGAIVASYGVYVGGSGPLTADSSQFIGTGWAVRIVNGTLYLAVSLVDGGVNNTGGTLHCFQVYDENYVAYVP